MTSAHLVQLSDLHLTSRETKRAWRADVWGGLRRALRELENHEPIDRLVLTGDIANRPSRRAYEMLRRELEPWLDRVRILPGNHDGRRSLCSVFADRLEPGRANFQDEVGGWRLLGLDSKRFPFVHGKLGRRQLDWLRARLDEASTQTIVFFHHPPLHVGTWWLDKDRVRDWKRLAEVVRGSSVRAIFFGHVHQPFEGELEGVRVLGCPSTAYQFAPGSLRPAAIEGRYPRARSIELGDTEITTRVLGWPDA